MLPRLLTFSIIAAALLAGGLVAMREGWLNGWKMRLSEMMSSGTAYSEARFRVDLVDQLNYARGAAKLGTLRVDPELEEWLRINYAKLDTADLNKVTTQVQDGMPRYFRVSVCSASSPEGRVTKQELSTRPCHIQARTREPHEPIAAPRAREKRNPHPLSPTPLWNGAAGSASGLGSASCPPRRWSRRPILQPQPNRVNGTDPLRSCTDSRMESA